MKISHMYLNASHYTALTSFKSHSTYMCGEQFPYVVWFPNVKGMFPPMKPLVFEGLTNLLMDKNYIVWIKC